MKWLKVGLKKLKYFVELGKIGIAIISTMSANSDLNKANDFNN